MISNKNKALIMHTQVIRDFFLDLPFMVIFVFLETQYAWHCVFQTKAVSIILTFPLTTTAQSDSDTMVIPRKWGEKWHRHKSDGTDTRAVAHANVTMFHLMTAGGSDQAFKSKSVNL